MREIIDQAFILAAGFGTRLRPHTNDRPKPMVDIGGRSLIERTLDHLSEAGVKQACVNTHYLGAMLHDHLKNIPDIGIIFSDEDPILDTGGGIKKALAEFHGQDFYVLSGDGLWSDAPGQNTLKTMQAAWDPDKMDILILLQDISTMTLTHGVGDYHLGADGRATRAHDQGGDYMFTSMRINASHIFDDCPEGAFSYLSLLDAAERKGRLYGLVHEGDWHHISTPEDLKRVRGAYKAQKEAV